MRLDLCCAAVPLLLGCGWTARALDDAAGASCPWDCPWYEVAVPAVHGQHLEVTVFSLQSPRGVLRQEFAGGLLCPYKQ